MCQAANRFRTTVRLALALLVLPGAGAAQPPIQGVETVQSQAFRYSIDTVISRGGWYLIGRVPEGYRIGDGVTSGHAAPTAAYLQACSERAGFGFGALERTIPAEHYIGKRVRLMARVRNDSSDRVSLYLTALSPDGVILRGRDQRNIQRGDWRNVEIVMDVPSAATLVEVGLLLYGSSMSSRAWLDDMSIEAVDDNVPLAGGTMVGTYQRPMNQRIVDCDGKRTN